MRRTKNAPHFTDKYAFNAFQSGIYSRKAGKPREAPPTLGYYSIYWRRGWDTENRYILKKAKEKGA